MILQTLKAILASTRNLKERGWDMMSVFRARLRPASAIADRRCSYIHQQQDTELGPAPRGAEHLTGGLDA